MADVKIADDLKAVCPRCSGALIIESTSFVDPSSNKQVRCNVCKGSGTIWTLGLQEMAERVSRAEGAIDHHLVTAGIGVFKAGDDPFNAIKMLMDWQGGVSEYFAKEKYEKIIADRDATIAEQGRRIERLSAPVSDEDAMEAWKANTREFMTLQLWDNMFPDVKQRYKRIAAAVLAPRAQEVLNG